VHAIKHGLSDLIGNYVLLLTVVYLHIIVIFTYGKNIFIQDL